MAETITDTGGVTLRCQPGSHIFTNMASCQCGQVRVNPTATGATTMNVRITPTLLLPENDDARMLHELANALLVHMDLPSRHRLFPSSPQEDRSREKAVRVYREGACT